MPVKLALVLVAACRVGNARSGRTATHTRRARVPITALAAAPIAAPSGQAAAPWTLTASDGSGLQLTRVDAKAVVQGPLAFTELHLYFHNPEDRDPRGHVRDHAAARRRGVALRDGERRPVAGGRGRREGSSRAARTTTSCTAGRIPRCSRRPPATSSPRACSRSRRTADKHIVICVQPGAAGRALRAAAARAAEDRARRRRSSTTTRARRHASRADADGAQLAAGSRLRRRRAGDRRGGRCRARWSSAQLAVSTDGAGAAPDDADGDDAARRYQRVARARLRALRRDRSATLVGALRTSTATRSRSRSSRSIRTREPIFSGPASGYGDAQDEELHRARRGRRVGSRAGDRDARRAAAPRVVVVTDGVITAGPETPGARRGDQRSCAIERARRRARRRHPRRARSRPRSCAPGLPHAGDVLDLDRGIDDVVAGLGEAVADRRRDRGRRARRGSIRATIPVGAPRQRADGVRADGEARRSAIEVVDRRHARARSASRRATPALVERAVAARRDRRSSRASSTAAPATTRRRCATEIATALGRGARDLEPDLDARARERRRLRALRHRSQRARRHPRRRPRRLEQTHRTAFIAQDRRDRARARTRSSRRAAPAILGSSATPGPRREDVASLADDRRHLERLRRARTSTAVCSVTRPAR